MKPRNLAANNSDLRLVPVEIERDAPKGVEWLQGSTGRETLRLMGVTDADNHESNLDEERIRLQDMIENEIAWMIEYESRIVGVVEIKLQASEHIPAPVVSIMLGDPAVRGKGVGYSALSTALDYLRMSGYVHCYARHLLENHASAGLLAKCGFTDIGGTYMDADGLKWQNVRKELTDAA